MTPSDKKKAYWGAGAAFVLIGGLLLRRNKKITQPDFYLPNSTANVYSGQMFLLRLPRGQYIMATGDDALTIASQSDHGNNTLLSLIVAHQTVDTTVSPLFVDVDDGTKQFSLTVNVVALEGAESEPMDEGGAFTDPDEMEGEA